MSVDSGVIDRNFFSGNIVEGSVGGHIGNDVLKEDDLLDCPPGFENAIVSWGLGFGGADDFAGMHGKDLCEIGDEMSINADSGANYYLRNDAEIRIGDVVDCYLVDVTEGNLKNTSALSDCKLLNVVRRTRDASTMVKSGYASSSLVWGKRRSHPWWPGQIFDPADSSKEALRHYKDGKFLVAYFGDGTFSWNDVTQLQPFQLHFERMVSRSDLETFYCAVGCALDEVFRRVVFGLSCTCLPEDVYAGIQPQAVKNSGVYRNTRRRDVGDECSNVECFVPSNLVSYVKEAATFHREFINKLELVKCKAQLTTFCCWKGYRKPPEFAYFRGLPDNNEVFNDLNGRDSRMAMAMANNAHQVVLSNFAITEDLGEHQSKRRGRGRPKGSFTARQKRKKMSDLMDRDEVLVPAKCRGRGRPKGSFTARQKKKMLDVMDRNEVFVPAMCRGRGRPKGSFTARQKKKMSDVMDSDEVLVPPNHVEAKRKAKHKARVEGATEHKIGKGICKSKKMKFDRIITAGDSCITPSAERNVTEGLSPYVLSTKLALTAIDPWNDHDSSVPLNDPISTEPNKSLEDSDEMIDNVIPEYKYRAAHSELVECSYSTDRIVKESAANKCFMDSHDGPVSVIAERTTRVVLPIIGLETVHQLHIFSDVTTQDTGGNHEPAENILDITGNQVPYNHKDKMMQTALILRFSEQNPVPSVTDLNKIFSCYGPLHESETKIMKKSVAKVIFKRNCDAVVAFSSTGKYSIFGPSLISYRLKYLTAKPKNIPSQSGKLRKNAA